MFHLWELLFFQRRISAKRLTLADYLVEHPYVRYANWITPIAPLWQDFSTRNRTYKTTIFPPPEKWSFLQNIIWRIDCLSCIESDQIRSRHQEQEETLKAKPPSSANWWRLCHLTKQRGKALPQASSLPAVIIARRSVLCQHQCFLFPLWYLRLISPLKFDHITIL